MPFLFLLEFTSSASVLVILNQFALTIKKWTQKFLIQQLD